MDDSKCGTISAADLAAETDDYFHVDFDDDFPTKCINIVLTYETTTTDAPSSIFGVASGETGFSVTNYDDTFSINWQAIGY